jgi:predicted metalloprotease with PDZ domain
MPKLSSWSCACGSLVLLALTCPPVRSAEPAPGTPIQLELDATEAPRKLLRARLIIPAKPGPLTLHYPKWIPGEHAPSGPLSDLAGLKLRAGDRAIEWRRDDVDPYTLYCEVPAGATSVEASLEYLMPTSTSGFTGGASSTPKLAVLNWNAVLLYPHSAEALKLPFQASVRLPDGWKFSTALPVTGSRDGRVSFGPVPLETLIDSPVAAGAHLREIPIGPDREPRHYLVLVSDSASETELKPEMKAKFDRLITESEALFGARHYRSYRFLLTLSDHVAQFGLEHHECNDSRVPERALSDPQLFRATAYLLPHEYVHSWNGKYRRPADMVTVDYQQPQRTRMLWVYEGLTHYLMILLTARSGLWTPQETQDFLAVIAERMDNQRGRAWRPLEDTTVAAPHLYFAAPQWGARRRGVDFYEEGVLLWLEIDTLIRQRSGGKKSLDDFCRHFFGGENGPPMVRPYTLDELAAALNEVAPYDWKGHLMRRLTAVTEQAPLEGLRQSGWKLTFVEQQTDYHKSEEALMKRLDLTSTLGLVLTSEGTVLDVIPGKPADQARICPGMKLTAVNGRRWSAERLAAAVSATKEGAKLELLLEDGDFFRTCVLDYRGGARYPRLERTKTGQDDLLAKILAPAGKAPQPEK